MVEVRIAKTLSAALAATMIVAACGGGGDGSSSGGGGGTLTIASATPAAQNTTVDLSKAVSSGNDARAADAFSASAYCEVYWEDATGANGKKYALQVYFRQSDRAPLHVSVVESSTSGPASWVVFHNNAGNPITGITVDTAARTLNFANKALTGSAGEAATLSGTVSFKANGTTPACGA